MQSQLTFQKKLNQFGRLPDNRGNNWQFNWYVSGVVLNRFQLNGKSKYRFTGKCKNDTGAADVKRRAVFTAFI